MKKRRAGAGVAELHGYLYVVGQSVISRLSLIIIFRAGLSQSEALLSVSHYHIQGRP